MDDCAAVNPPADILQHATRDRGHARHDEDIAELEAWRGRDGVEDQLCALGNAGHAHAAFVDLLTAGLVIGAEDRNRVLPHINGLAEGGCDGIGGDVVMRRADAAGGKDIIMGGAQLVDGGDDGGVDIGDHARLAHFDPERIEEIRDGLEVGVLGAPRKELIPDQDNGGGHDAGHAPRLRLLHSPVQPQFAGCPDC